MRYLAIALLFLTACAGSLEQRTRTALDVLGRVVEPASKLALDQCAAVADALADAHETAKLAKATERCEKIIDAVDHIAGVQEAAIEALENGNVQLAEDMARQIPVMWNSLRGEL